MAVTKTTLTQVVNKADVQLVKEMIDLSLEDVFGLEHCCSSWSEVFKVVAMVEELNIYNDEYTEDQRRCIISALESFGLVGGCK